MVPEFISPRQRAFYQQVWRLALHDGDSNWCCMTAEHRGPAGVLALVPRAHNMAAGVRLWPTLPEEDPDGRPGFVPTSDNIGAAYTRIIIADDMTYGISLDDRQALWLARQHCQISKLTPAQADLVLQVAVFDELVFP